MATSGPSRPSTKGSSTTSVVMVQVLHQPYGVDLQAQPASNSVRLRDKVANTIRCDCTEERRIGTVTSYCSGEPSAFSNR